MDLSKSFDALKGQLFGSRDSQSPDEVKLVAHIRGKIDDSRQIGARVQWEANTMSNIAYLLGFDSVYYDSRTRQFRTLYQYNYGLSRNRLRANKIMPRAQNRAARLCKVPPRYDVKPESSQTDDKDAARLSLDVINMIWDRERINQKRIPLVMWTQQGGFAYIKTSWDDQKGRMIAPGLYEGDVRVEVVSPFELFVDPLATTIQEAQWVIQAKVRKLDYFKEHYPEKGHLVKEEDAWLLSTQYELRINSLNANGPSAATSDLQMKNSAIELSYYEKPSRKYPEGRQIVCANGILLEDKELPIGEIPFAKFDDIVVGGKYFSDCVLTHARPIQDQYTRLISKRAQWTNRLLAGKYMAPRGHGMSPESLNNESGELLEYNANPAAPRNGEPTHIPVPVIPQYAYVEEDRLERMLDDIFGLNEISNGRVPEAGMPAAGMQILLEQDATRIGIVTENHEHAWADVGRHILKFVSRYYVTPRLLKVAGKGLDYTVKSFQGADLKNNTDVYVVRGSTIPNSKVLERAEIKENYQMGLMGDPADPKLREKVFAMLEYGDTSDMWQDFSIDMSQIARDFDMIKDGGIPAVNELDNHPLHIQEKNRFRKSDKYMALDDMQKAVLEANIEEHLQWVVKLSNPGLDQEIEMSEQMAQSVSQMTPEEALQQEEMANAGFTPPPVEGAM